MRDRHPDDRLSAFLDDELDEAVSLDVARHVAECPRCMAELDDLRTARAALRGLPELTPPPSLFSDAVTSARHATSRPWRVVTAVTAGLLALLIVAFAVGGDSGDVVPPVDVVVVDHVARTGGGPVFTPVDLTRR